MPQIKSAKKRVKQTAVRAARNRQVKSRAKKAVRSLIQLTSEGKAEEARNTLPQVLKVVDTAWSKGVWHKNKAARTKARLTKKVNELTTA